MKRATHFNLINKPLRLVLTKFFILHKYQIQGKKSEFGSDGEPLKPTHGKPQNNPGSILISAFPFCPLG
jgi:hypothetical protein